MKIKKLLKLCKNESEEDLLGMILSNRIDVMFNDTACISEKAWDKLIQDLITWKKVEQNAD